MFRFRLEVEVSIDLLRLVSLVSKLCQNMDAIYPVMAEFLKHLIG